MKIGDLFIALGIKVDQEKLARFQKGINNLQRDIITLKAAFIASAFALDRFVDGTVRGSVSLQNLSNQTGLAIDKLQRLNQAGQLADLTLSADAITQSIGNLERNLAAIKLGQGNIAPFQLLGIDPAGKDAFQVIEQVRESIKGLSPAVATNLIQQLGLTPQFINILRLSRKEFEALSENTFLNKSQRENVIRLGTAITRLKLRFKALKDQAVAKLTPLLIEMVDKFFKWMRDNGDKIINTISGIARAITLFVQAIGRSIGLLGEFIEKLFGVENGIQIIAAAVGVLLGAMLLGFRRLGRLTLFGIIIGFLEDIAVWHKGGEAAFGGVYDKIAEGLRFVKSEFADFVEFLDKIFLKIEKFIIKPFKKGASLDVDEQINRTQTNEGFFKNLLDSTLKDLGFSTGLLPAIAGGSGLLGERATSNSNQNITNNFNITNNIDGAQSPAAVAEEVTGALTQLNNGGS